MQVFLLIEKHAVKDKQSQYFLFWMGTAVKDTDNFNVLKFCQNFYYKYKILLSDINIRVSQE